MEVVKPFILFSAPCYIFNGRKCILKTVFVGIIDTVQDRNENVLFSNYMRRFIHLIKSDLMIYAYWHLLHILCY